MIHLEIERNNSFDLIHPSIKQQYKKKQKFNHIIYQSIYILLIYRLNKTKTIKQKSF